MKDSKIKFEFFCTLVVSVSLIEKATTAIECKQWYDRACGTNYFVYFDLSVITSDEYEFVVECLACVYSQSLKKLS